MKSKSKMTVILPVLLTAALAFPASAQETSEAGLGVDADPDMARQFYEEAASLGMDTTRELEHLAETPAA